MNGNLRFARDHAHHAKIGDNHRVDFRAGHLLDKVRKTFHVAVERKAVERDIHFDTLRMRKLDGFFQLFGSEIIRRRAQTKLLSGQVDSIRSIGSGRFQLIETACGREKFGFKHGGIIAQTTD